MLATLFGLPSGPGGFSYDFGTQRTIFGTQRKACQETTAELCCRKALVRRNQTSDFYRGHFISC